MAAPELAQPDRDLAIEEMKPHPLRFVIPGVLGLALWTVAVWPSLEIELASPDARILVSLLYLTPLVALGVGLFTRSSALVIALFLASLGLSFTVMQPLALRVANTLSGAATLAALAVVFVLGTARWGPRKADGTTLHATPLRGGVEKASRGLVWYTAPRLALLAALFVLPLHALYGEAGQAAIEANFIGRELDAMVLIHTVHLFVGVLVAYLFFLSPSINMPIELDDLRRQMQYAASEPRAKASRRNLLVYFLVGALLVVLFAWLRTRGGA